MKLFIYIAKHNETLHWSREFQIFEGDSSARIHGTVLFIDGMWPGRWSENKYADVYIWNIARSHFVDVLHLLILNKISVWFIALESDMKLFLKRGVL